MATCAPTGWTAAVHPAFTTLSPDRAAVYSFDLEGRPLSWFEEGQTFKRSLGSTVHGRRRVGGVRHRWVLDDAEASEQFSRILQRVTQAPRDRLPQAVYDRLDTILDWTPARLLAERERFAAAYRPIAILPPDQYLSIVVQATRGCTWNRCTFCNFYQDREFHTLGGAGLGAHLDRIAALLGRAAVLRRRIFLADGNALVLSNRRLRPLVDAMCERFPGRPWFGFVDVLTGERKSASDWCELRHLGLGRVYVGMETGHDPLLELLNKPGSAERMIEFVSTLRRAGIRVSVIVMAGVGGDRYAPDHVRDTLAALGRMPLGEGDLVYVSPFLEHAESEYARLCGTLDIRSLDAADIEAQENQLRRGVRERLPEIQAARYDVREFIY
jgi:hypothetical protein